MTWSCNLGYVNTSSRSFCVFSAVPSRLLREIKTSRSTPRTCPSLFTSAESFVGKTATWSPDSYLKIQPRPWPWATKHLRQVRENQPDLILEPVMSSSRCMRCLSPALLSLRLTVAGARKGFFESKGLKQSKAIFEWGKENNTLNWKETCIFGVH